MGKNDAVRRSKTIDVSFNPQYRRPCGEKRIADNSVNDKFTRNNASIVKQQIVNTRLCVNHMLDFNGYKTATVLSLIENADDEHLKIKSMTYKLIRTIVHIELEMLEFIKIYNALQVNVVKSNISCPLSTD